MDLGAIYKTEFAKHFDLFGSALLTVTYNTLSSVYNAETGEVDDTAVAYPNKQMLQERKRLEQILGETLDNDETGLSIPTNDLEVTPKPDDYIVSGGDEYRVIAVYPDNFNAKWLLQVKHYKRG